MQVWVMVSSVPVPLHCLTFEPSQREAPGRHLMPPPLPLAPALPNVPAPPKSGPGGVVFVPLQAESSKPTPPMIAPTFHQIVFAMTLLRYLKAPPAPRPPTYLFCGAKVVSKISDRHTGNFQ